MPKPVSHELCTDAYVWCDVCSIHVASVVQMTHMLLCHGGIMQSKALSNIQLLSAYWSAAVHDFEHGGVNNDFLIKTAHPLAITYNDQSPLENHHLAAAVRLMFDPDLSYLPVSSCCIVQAVAHCSGFSPWGSEEPVHQQAQALLERLICQIHHNPHHCCVPIGDNCMLTFSHMQCASLCCAYA